MKKITIVEFEHSPEDFERIYGSVIQRRKHEYHLYAGEESNRNKKLFEDLGVSKVHPIEEPLMESDAYFLDVEGSSDGYWGEIDADKLRRGEEI